MATAPNFTGTPRVGVASVSTSNANRDGTGTIVDVITGASTGTKIQEIVIKSTNDPADSIVTLFLNDGTTNWLFDEIDLGNPAAGSTTVTAYRTVAQYSNLILPNASWKVRAAITVAPTAGVINVFAVGGDF
jgi:hypothetical protein